MSTFVHDDLTVSCIFILRTLQVNQIKDKISAKEQHIADLQKKAQVIYVMIFKGFCCHHLPHLYMR